MRIASTIIACALAAGTVFAATPAAKVQRKAEKKDYTPEQLAELREKARVDYYNRTGGRIRKPGHGNGKVVVFNAQERVAESNLAATARMLNARLRVTFAVERLADGEVGVATAKGQLGKSGAAAGVFVIDRPDFGTTLLAAPEDGWAIVNVAALAADGAELPFVVTRTQKEVFRALAACANGIDSQSREAMTGMILKPSELDSFPGVMAPSDVLSRIGKGLTRLGADPWVETSYISACQHGWAPPPTNDVQKAIWDKVHQMPTAPLKIKPEAKKVAE